MSLQKIALLSLKQVIIVLLVSSSCLAYFEDGNEMKPFIAAIAFTNEAQSLFSHYFVLNDNDEYQSSFKSKSSVPQHSPGHFIYAFNMPILEVVTQQKTDYVPYEFTIENILYANLKLVKLIDEYNSLKERSKSILTGLDVPYVNQHSGLLISQKQRELSLSSKITSLKSQIQTIAGPTFSVQKTVGRQHFGNQLQGHPSPKKRPLHTLKQPLVYAPGSAYTNNGGSVAGPETDNTVSSESAQYNPTIGEHLPFIERIGKSLLTYFRTNKLEFIIYLVVLFALYHLLIGLRKR
jgi:hypothetical protein